MDINFVERSAALYGIGAMYDGEPLDVTKLTLVYPVTNRHEDGPFDPDELVRYAESYGHPEEWIKKAQELHATVERLETELDSLRVRP